MVGNQKLVACQRVVPFYEEDTSSQNLANRNKTILNKSGYKGVTFMRDSGHAKRPWRAVITCMGEYYNLGYFETPKEAARAYNERARQLFGEFAKFNPV